MGCLVCTLLGKSGIEDEIESDEHRKEIIQELRDDLKHYHPREINKCLYSQYDLISDDFKKIVLIGLRNLCNELGYPSPCIDVAEDFSYDELGTFLSVYKNYLNK